MSAAPGGAAQTLETIRIISNELGCATTLGLSNVSFGLPLRKSVHNTFLAQAIADCYIQSHRKLTIAGYLPSGNVF